MSTGAALERAVSQLEDCQRDLAALGQENSRLNVRLAHALHREAMANYIIERLKHELELDDSMIREIREADRP